MAGYMHAPPFQFWGPMEVPLTCPSTVTFVKQFLLDPIPCNCRVHLHGVP